MDSMPATPFGLPNLDALKVEEPEVKTQHVEDNTQNFVSAFIERHLPRGVSESDIEKEKKWFIGSIDCGTTSSRFLIFDGTGTPAASHQIEFENIYPDSG